MGRVQEIFPGVLAGRKGKKGQMVDGVFVIGFLLNPAIPESDARPCLKSLREFSIQDSGCLHGPRIIGIGCFVVKIAFGDKNVFLAKEHRFVKTQGGRTNFVVEDGAGGKFFGHSEKIPVGPAPVDPGAVIGGVFKPQTDRPRRTFPHLDGNG